MFKYGLLTSDWAVSVSPAAGSVPAQLRLQRAAGG